VGPGDVSARASSTVIALSYYIAEDQPDWVRTGLTIGILLSLLGLGLMAGWWLQVMSRSVP
jgi:hypothetical protein